MTVKCQGGLLGQGRQHFEGTSTCFLEGCSRKESMVDTSQNGTNILAATLFCIEEMSEFGME